MAFTTINNGSLFMNPKLYTGDGNSTQAITGVGFQPDLVWLKNRSDSTWHQLIDVVRGTGAAYTLASNSNEGNGGGSTNQYGFISALSSDGFTVSAGSSNASVVNQNGNNYVAWNWKANGSGSANTAGSINSTVSVNTTSGFSIVKYTGTGANATVGHGLGSAPKMVIVKNLAAAESWFVYHADLTSAAYTINLNTTGAQFSNASTWNSTAPSNSVFYVGSDAGVNGSGDTYIAYCFEEKQGFSKFSSYTGNGNANGPFVYTGFKPAFVMIKRTDTTQDWYMLDNKRNTFNPVDKYLLANASDAETTFTIPDFLSNGFKLRTTGGGTNASGGSYIYMAFGQSLVGTNNIPNNAF